jgi:hypothetical protein
MYRGLGDALLGSVALVVSPNPDERELVPITSWVIREPSAAPAPSTESAFYHLHRPLQIRAGMGQTKEPGLELRRCKIDAGT